MIYACHTPFLLAHIVYDRRGFFMMDERTLAIEQTRQLVKKRIQRFSFQLGFALFITAILFILSLVQA